MPTYVTVHPTVRGEGGSTMPELENLSFLFNSLSNMRTHLLRAAGRLQ